MCEYCTRKSREKGTEPPPCETCRVDPLPENENAVNVFFETRYQLIMGPSGPIDINHLAVDAAIKRHGIEDLKCFDRIIKLAHWWIERVKEENEA